MATMLVSFVVKHGACTDRCELWNFEKVEVQKDKIEIRKTKWIRTKLTGEIERNILGCIYGKRGSDG